MEGGKDVSSNEIIRGLEGVREGFWGGVRKS